MKTLLTFFLILSPLAASAQQGSILFDRAVRYDFEVPEAWAEMNIPTANVSSVLLLFNASVSLMIPAQVEEEVPTRMTRAQGAAARLKMGSTSRSDHESLLKAYVNYEDGTIAETREFMGRTFLISGMQHSYSWKLTGEQSEFLGYMVQKATAVQDSSTIEAWFTSDIPVSAGPGLFGGLPGMILIVSVDDGHMVFSATQINLEGLADSDLEGLEDGAIQAPEDGSKVSRDEYEQIVAEKMIELETARSSRRRRRR